MMAKSFEITINTHFFIGSEEKRKSGAGCPIQARFRLEWGDGLGAPFKPAFEKTLA
jgi:hypothetical protein